MKKILVVDESPLFRQYLKQKLEEYKFEVVLGVNGLDALVKIRSTLPDLVIMDYYLSRRSSLEVLQEKARNPNAAGIPVIMASTRIDKSKLLEVAKFNVIKFFTKPLRIDVLLKAISEILGVSLALDDTPSIIDAHFNDEILFIEIAQGLNKEKIELLRYKIIELLELYQQKKPKVLIIMSDVSLGGKDAAKLSLLLDNVLEATRSPEKAIKILTNSDFVKSFVDHYQEFSKIEVVDNINQAMDGLLGLKVSGFIEEGHTVVRGDFLTSTRPKPEGKESIQMRFDPNTVKGGPSEALEKIAGFDKAPTIAAVDDDIVIRELVKTTFSAAGWQVDCFENGKQFVESLSGSSYDLLFLDLLMPEMNGFQVLQYLQEQQIQLPVIVLSALSKKDTVLKALQLGVKSYLIKPLKPENILAKATEVVRMNF